MSNEDNALYSDEASRNLGVRGAIGGLGVGLLVWHPNMWGQIVGLALLVGGATAFISYFAMLLSLWSEPSERGVEPVPQQRPLPSPQPAKSQGAHVEVDGRRIPINPKGEV